MNEIKIQWKDIPQYEGIYKISNYGNVLNIKRNKELKPQKDKFGYLRVHLVKNNTHKSCLIHRLVAEAFIPNSNNLPQINHKDENKLNNCIDNLEWCTAKYNCNYGTRVERAKNKISQANKGKHYSIDTEFKKGYKAWHKGKSTYYTAKKVRCVELNKIYNSITDASKDLGLLVQNICRSCKTNYKTGGYSFKYE